MATHSKFDFYKNNLPDDFPSNQDHFKFLGLLTERKDDLLKLRGKPLSLKSRSKGNIDMVCRNAREFEEYLSKGSFQRHHIFLCQRSVSFDVVLPSLIGIPYVYVAISEKI